MRQCEAKDAEYETSQEGLLASHDRERKNRPKMALKLVASVCVGSGRAQSRTA
jgi:hypothetical protein